MTRPVDAFDQDGELGRKGRGGRLGLELLAKMIKRITDAIERLQPLRVMP